jgi:hypothetical protein
MELPRSITRLANPSLSLASPMGCCSQVLRLQPGQQAEEADVQFAANLSCFFSKARHSTETLVDYTSPKNISRARGGYLGMVNIKQNSSVYTVWARPADVSELAEASAQL